MSIPSKCNRPLDGDCRMAATRISDNLPAPLRPSIPNSPPAVNGQRHPIKRGSPVRIGMRYLFDFQHVLQPVTWLAADADGALAEHDAHRPLGCCPGHRCPTHEARLVIGARPSDVHGLATLLRTGKHLLVFAIGNVLDVDTAPRLGSGAMSASTPCPADRRLCSVFDLPVMMRAMKPGTPGTDISTVVDVTSHLPGASARSAARAADGSMMKAAARVLSMAICTACSLAQPAPALCPPLPFTNSGRLSLDVP